MRRGTGWRQVMSPHCWKRPTRGELFRRLALALGCGLVASIGISQVLDGNSRPAAVATTPIYVALQNINVGDQITEKMVSLEEWPKDKVPAGAVVKWENLEGRRPRSNVYQGEPILENKMLAKGQTNDPIQGVPTGMRLKTITVDAAKSAAGLLSPGDHVDVQMFVQRDERNNVPMPFTKIFLQNIRVYAVDQAIEKTADGSEARSVAKTVSMVVTPEQANRITLAENLGTLTLIPRHPDDEAVVDDSMQDAGDLLNPSSANSRRKEQFGSQGEDEGATGGLKSLVQQAMAGAAAQALAKPVAPPFQMTIVYPNEVSKVKFDAAGEPMSTSSTGSSGAVPPPIPAAAVSAAPTPPATAPAEGAKTPADFPIDLQIK